MNTKTFYLTKNKKKQDTEREEFKVKNIKLEHTKSTK